MLKENLIKIKKKFVIRIYFIDNPNYISVNWLQKLSWY